MMTTASQIEGGWNELKGKVKQRWGNLNDDELTAFEGNVDEFVGMLQRKTGETRDAVERALDQLDAEVQPWLRQAQETAKQYTDAANQTVANVRDQFADGQVQAKRYVKKHPMESIAAALGTGIIVGVVVGLLVRGR